MFKTGVLCPVCGAQVYFENMGVVLYNKEYRIIELFILLQLIQVLTPGSNLINFYVDQKEVGAYIYFTFK